MHVALGSTWVHFVMLAIWHRLSQSIERERDSWSFYLFACASNFGAAVKLTTFLCFLKRIGLLDRDMTDMGLSRTAA